MKDFEACNPLPPVADWQSDWRAFLAGGSLSEASQQGLQEQMIPAWVRRPEETLLGFSFADRAQASAYGETPPYLIEAILDRLAPQPDELFVDLGCGGGNVCAAVLARGARVLGIEANPELANAARAFLRNAPPDRCQFLEADFLQADWSPAHIAYATTARFPDSLLRAIADRAEQAVHLRAFAALGRPLPMDWPVQEQFERLVCWNPGENPRWEQLYLYHRQDGPKDACGHPSTRCLRKTD